MGAVRESRARSGKHFLVLGPNLRLAHLKIKRGDRGWGKTGPETGDVMIIT